jgi:hypothetical protein
LRIVSWQGGDFPLEMLSVDEFSVGAIFEKGKFSLGEFFAGETFHWDDGISRKIPTEGLYWHDLKED